MAKVYPPGLLLVYKEVIPQPLPNSSNQRLQQQKTDLDVLSTSPDQPKATRNPDVEYARAAQTSSISSFADQISKKVSDKNLVNTLLSPNVGQNLMSTILTTGKDLSGLYLRTTNVTENSNYFIWNLNLRTNPQITYGQFSASQPSWISDFVVPYITNVQNLKGVALASVKNGYNGDAVYHPAVSFSLDQNPDPQAIKDMDQRQSALNQNQYYYPDAINLTSSKNSSLIYPSLAIRKRLQFYINSPALTVKQESPGVYYVDVPGSAFDDTIYQGADTKPTIQDLYGADAFNKLTILKMPTGQYILTTASLAVNTVWPAGFQVITSSASINQFVEGAGFKLPKAVYGVIKALKVTNTTSWPVDTLFKTGGWNSGYPVNKVVFQPDNKYRWFLPITSSDGFKTFSIDQNTPYGHKANRVYLANVQVGDLVRVFYHNHWQATSQIINYNGKQSSLITIGAVDESTNCIQGMVIASRVFLTANGGDLTKPAYDDFVLLVGGNSASGGVDQTPFPSKELPDAGKKLKDPTTKLSTQAAQADIVPPDPPPPEIRFYQLNFGDIANPDGAIQKQARFGFGIQKLSVSGHARKTVQQTKGIIKGDQVQNNFFVDTFWVGPETIQMQCVIEMPYAVNVPIITSWQRQVATDDSVPIPTPPGEMNFYQAINQFYLWNSHPERSNRGDELWLYDYSIGDEKSGLVVDTIAYKLSFTQRSWSDDVNEPNIKRLSMEFIVLDTIKVPTNQGATGPIPNSLPNFLDNTQSNSIINQATRSLAQLTNGATSFTGSQQDIYAAVSNGGDATQVTTAFLDDLTKKQLGVDVTEISNFPSFGV